MAEADWLSTEELLQRLRSVASPDDYLEHGATVECTLREYPNRLLDKRGMRRAEVIRACGLHPTVVYDIFAGKSRPGRDHAIMLAFGLHASLDEAQQILHLANNAELWPNTKRDAIIIWCLENDKTRAECDDELWRLQEKTLLKTDKRAKSLESGVSLPQTPPQSQHQRP